MNCPKHGCAMTETITDDIFCGVCERVRLNAEIKLLREGLLLITCEPINAEFMAQNILDGLPPYHNTMTKG